METWAVLLCFGINLLVIHILMASHRERLEEMMKKHENSIVGRVSRKQAGNLDDRG